LNYSKKTQISHKARITTTNIVANTHAIPITIVFSSKFFAVWAFHRPYTLTAVIATVAQVAIATARTAFSLLIAEFAFKVFATLASAGSVVATSENAVAFASDFFG